MVLARGPRENGFRPAADPLFRTAARVFGPRVVGVVLSGGLDDGTEGAALVKAFGGVAVVQDPDEATFPGMPTSAIANVRIDHVLPAARIGKLIARLASEPLPQGAHAMSTHNPDEADRPDLAEVGDASLATGDIPGPPSGFTCPECGGALWELRSGKLLKFRCHVGHSYTTEALISEQTRSLESALWAALRSLEENAGLRRRLARRARDSNWGAIATQYDKQAEEAEARASVIRKVLMADEVHDAQFKADPRPPRPAYDGPLYGSKGRKGAPGAKGGSGGGEANGGKNNGDGNGNVKTAAKAPGNSARKDAGAKSPKAGPAGGAGTKGKRRRGGEVI
jgi:two-component system chemotaxis response regulator CheB